jgi:cytochrome c
VNFQGLNAITFRVSGGAAATAGAPRAAVELRLDAPDGPIAAAVTLTDTGGNNVFQSQTAPLTDPGGTHRLYLVFQSVAGGPASNLFNLNWFEFVGGGVAAEP